MLVKVRRHDAGNEKPRDYNTCDKGVKCPATPCWIVCETPRHYKTGSSQRAEDDETGIAGLSFVQCDKYSSQKPT